MNAARDEILRRIGAIERPQVAALSRGYVRGGALSVDARISLFCERVADYRAEVVRASEAAEAVAHACSANHAQRVGVPAGLPAEWRPAGVELIEDHGLATTALDELDGAITGCTAGVAQTGTLVLSASGHEGRRALTLVPDLHICVIDESQIFETLPEAIALLEGVRRPISFISGPSATSDIELSRVEGVHGPRRLVVVVVGEEVDTSASHTGFRCVVRESP